MSDSELLCIPHFIPKSTNSRNSEASIKCHVKQQRLLWVTDVSLRGTGGGKMRRKREKKKRQDRDCFFWLSQSAFSNSGIPWRLDTDVSFSESSNLFIFFFSRHLSLSDHLKLTALSISANCNTHLCYIFGTSLMNHDFCRSPTITGTIDTSKISKRTRE